MFEEEFLNPQTAVVKLSSQGGLVLMESGRESVFVVPQSVEEMVEVKNSESHLEAPFQVSSQDLIVRLL